MYDDEKFNELNQNIKNLTENISNLKLSKYIELINSPKRIFFVNFMWGLSRGLGMAVGFTILGAIVISILKDIVSINLPYIGNYITEIVRIVQQNLKY